MYTTCEAGKRRSVNHTRARSLASPSRAEAVGVGVAWRGEATVGSDSPVTALIKDNYNVQVH